MGQVTRIKNYLYFTSPIYSIMYGRQYGQIGCQLKDCPKYRPKLIYSFGIKLCSNLRPNFFCILRDLPLLTYNLWHRSICKIKSSNFFGCFSYIEIVQYKVLKGYSTFLGIPNTLGALSA